MTWYYTISPTHTRVCVFMNGAFCGHLRFRNAEFEQVLDIQNAIAESAGCACTITFINETPK